MMAGDEGRAFPDARSAAEEQLSTAPGRRLGTGVFWGLFRFGSLQGATFLFNLVAARVLGREAFGSFSLIQTTTQTLQQLGGLSVSSTATRFVASSYATDPLKTGRLIRSLLRIAGLSAVVTAGSLCLAAPALSVLVYRMPRMLVPLLLASIVVDLSLRGNARLGMLMGLERYRAVAVLSMIPMPLTIGLAYVAGRGFGVAGIVSVLVVDAGFKLILYDRKVKTIARDEGIPLHVPAEAAERRELKAFMVPALIPGFTAMPSVWFGQALLARGADGASAVAVFSACFTLRTLILIVPNVVCAVAFSIMNTERGRGRIVASDNVWHFSILVAIITGFLGIVGAKLGGAMALNLFGRAFRDGHLTLTILAASAAIEATWSALYQRVWSEGRMWPALVSISLPRDGAFAIGAALLASKFGASGLGIAHLVSNCVALIGVLILLIWTRKVGQTSSGAVFSAWQ
jgi:O-antigen/teichoic acid export membrane protein